MCGICGIATAEMEKQPEAGLIETMCSSLKHRGPDDEGTFLDQGIGLGMRRLSIIDVVGGHQPLFNEQRTVAAICNGEIYNYKSLREELLHKGHVFRTQSDVEVLPHLYEECGDEFPTRLKGMFAIAIWDREKHTLILVRDRAGEKPLYYHSSNGRFLFASEIKALLAAGVPRDIDEEAIDQFLSYKFIPAPRTGFAGIRKLFPGHMLIYKKGEYEIRRYWSPPGPGSGLPMPYEEAVERLRRTVKDAVRSQLVSDVPLGAFLSGGVDSSIIAACMSEASDKRVQTFSIGFNEKSYDERPFANLMASQLGTDHHELVVDWDILELLPRLVEQFDEPFADSSSLPTYYLSQLTRRHVTVALSGDAGDELFGGYSRYRALPLANQYNRAPRLVRELAERVMMRVIPESSEKIETSIPRKIRRFLQYAKSASSGSMTFLPTFQTDEKAELYSPSFQAAGPSTWRYLPNNGGDLVAAMMGRDFEVFLPDDILTKVDRMSMAHSLEARAPFLDVDVIEFAATLPREYKIDRKHQKRILKDAFRDVLPKDILERKKQGFVVPLSAWFQNELRALLEESLAESSGEFGKRFRHEYMGRLIREHAGRRADHSEKLWSLLWLRLWFDKFFH